MMIVMISLVTMFNNIHYDTTLWYIGLPIMTYYT